MFKCKSCSCKNEHIESLKKEIEFLKRLSLPTPILPQLDLDSNFIMNGSADARPEEPFDPEEAQLNEEAKQEQDRILSGNYDNY